MAGAEAKGGLQTSAGTGGFGRDNLAPLSLGSRQPLRRVPAAEGGGAGGMLRRQEGRRGCRRGAGGVGGMLGLQKKYWGCRRDAAEHKAAAAPLSGFGALGPPRSRSTGECQS